MSPFVFGSVAGLSPSRSSAQSVPVAIYKDPPVDPAHPAKMSSLRIPTHGLEINGIVYQPSGAGSHPALVICHGLPGNERFLDLAQTVRRAGWNAVAFNYRGSWGSPGAFRFLQNVEDAEAVLVYLRDPANAARLGVDPRRIVIVGHSMGGWVAVQTASRDHGLIGLVLISASDLGKQAEWPKERLLALVADTTGPLAGVTPESMADEIRRLGKLQFANAAAGLTKVPLLALTAEDGFAEDTEMLVRAIQGQGGHEVTLVHATTDHVWSGHRIALESTILTWLDELDKKRQ
jgi:uncharacterized protein